MDTGSTGGRLKQKVGRQMMLVSFSFLISDEEREGKSYGGPHLGNLGIVPAAVWVKASSRVECYRMSTDICVNHLHSQLSIFVRVRNFTQISGTNVCQRFRTRD